jgi:hypothetical protein
MALARRDVFVHILSVANCYCKSDADLYPRDARTSIFRLLRNEITEEEREIHEGASHGGMSAVINFTARRP